MLRNGTPEENTESGRCASSAVSRRALAVTIRDGPAVGAATGAIQAATFLCPEATHTESVELSQAVLQAYDQRSRNEHETGHPDTRVAP